MRRGAPKLALFAALFAAVAIVAAPIAAASGADPTANEDPFAGATAPPVQFAAGQVVVSFVGQRFGHTVALPSGVGVGEAISALRKNSHVRYAVPNYVASASAGWIPNDPGTPPGKHGKAGRWAHKQWNFLPCGSICDTTAPPLHLQSRGGIDAIGAWQNLIKEGAPGAAGITVAVLDTGIAYRKEKGYRRSPDFSPKQFLKGHDFLQPKTLPLDENGHGTHVAGTIAEQTNNGIALTGLAYRAKLMPVRVLNASGLGHAGEIAKGIRFAADHGADVINMSFNFSCKAKVPNVDDAIAYARRRGVVVVASVGNQGSETCVAPPATSPGVIGVGGTTEGGCLGNYSLAGSDVDLVAPGGGPSAKPCDEPTSQRGIVQLTLRGGNSLKFGLPGGFVGTSMAAAHVSGAAAMVLASGVLGADPTPQQVEDRLEATARDLDLPKKQQGAGLIDAATATAPAG
jgi:serine protease